MVAVIASTEIECLYFNLNPRDRVRSDREINLSSNPCALPALSEVVRGASRREVCRCG